MYAFGPFRLDAEAEILFRNGEPLPVGKRAVTLLRVLVERAGVPVSKGVLLEAAWAGLVVEESNLTVQIAAVRKVLGQEPGGERWIETLPRRGYRYVGPVEEADGASVATAPAPRPAASPLQTGPDRLAAMPRTEQQRRQLTIMICTMVASTPPADDLDPEEMSERIAPFHKLVTDEASRFGGFVAQHLSDGAHIHFGYPAAHEYDAEHAVRAGLAILAGVGALDAPFDAILQARVGIATGMVVVRDQGGAADAQQPIVIGEAPSLAARLQAVTAPGEIIIASSTRRLVGDMFDCHPVVSDRLAGLSPSVDAWQVRAEKVEVSRFDVRRAGKMSPFVGRQEEMDLLMRRWAQAKTGEGRVVLLSGEPGIGKSRIAETLLARLEGEPHISLRYFCSPHHTNSPLYPFIAQLERAARFEPAGSAEAEFDKLEALLERTSRNLPRDLALIADLLSVPTDGRYSVAAVSPQQKREMTLTALLDQLDGAAAQGTVLIVFEDAHWIDPTSLDLLDRTVARAADLPLLLLITLRPEVEPTWIGQPHVTMLPLSRLGRRDSVGMLDGVTKGKALPNAVVEQVLAHTDGVPLFIEELTSTLLESGVLRETPDSHVLDGPLPPLAIPTTLQASLVARLDRLGSVKDVAQMGAAIGREFSHELIAAVSNLALSDLDAALERLTASGLTSRRGVPPVATYAFKHALVQDAAYATMLKSRRRQLHARIAEAIERLHPEAAEYEPELLARHYTGAGRAEPAVGYWRRAGEQSVARYANREAIGHFERALEQLGALPSGEERDRLEADLRLAQAVPLIAVHGYGAQEVEFCALRAKELGGHRPDWAGHFAVHRLVWNSHMLRHPMPRTIALARDLLSLAEHSGDPARIAVACRALGFSLLFAGELVEADAVLARGAMHADGVKAADFAAYGESPTILCRLAGGWARSLMGCPGTALRMIGEGLARARESGNPHPISWALGILAVAHKLRRDAASTRGAAAEAVEVAGQHILPQWQGFAELWLGWALSELGQGAEGLALLQVAQRRLRDTGAVLFTVMSNCVLAEANLLAGRPQTALEHLATAQEHAERYSEGFMLAEVHRLHAIALRALRAPASECEGRLLTALGIAQRQGSKTWELRAAVDLARLWREQSRITDAHDLLARVYVSLTEGFDLPDLTEARSLLDELNVAASD